jgi:nicotinamidase-related amidase
MIPESLEELLHERSAILIWDMQEGLARRATNFITIAPVIRQLADLGRRTKRLVLYSQHYSLPLEAEDRVWLRTQWIRSGKANPASLRPLYPPGSPRWGFVPETAPTENDVVVAKTRANFFIGTPIRALLAARGVDVLVLVGVATDVGILATARDALLNGIFPIVVTDAVGAFSDAEQENGLRLLMQVAEMATSHQITAAWEGTDPRRT